MKQHVATTIAAAVATTAGSNSTTTTAAVATSVTHHRSSSSHHRSSSSHCRHSSSHRRHSSSHHSRPRDSRVEWRAIFLSSSFILFLFFGRELGLPSIVALVMTIDKSWTTISSRNSNAFLDGLFAFIAHCEPLLHPITRKIRCPCSRCCNCDNLVTLKTLEVHISRHGFDQHYTTWKYHGEPILPLPPPVPYSPEHIDMDAFFEDISANNVPTPPTQTTDPQPAQTTGPNNEFDLFGAYGFEYKCSIDRSGRPTS
ncbi:zinc finger, CCHC-type containing protein [Tanacetum coccineum]